MFRDKLLNQCFLASLFINSLAVCAVGHAQLARQVALLTGEAASSAKTRIAALHPIRVGLYHPPIPPKLVAVAAARHGKPSGLTPAASVPDGAPAPLENATAAQAPATGETKGDGHSASSSNANDQGGADGALSRAARLAAQATANTGQEGTSGETRTGNANSSAEAGRTSAANGESSDTLAGGSSHNSGARLGHGTSVRSGHQSSSHAGNATGSHDGQEGHGASDNSGKSTGAVIAARLALQDGNAAADTPDSTDTGSATSDTQEAGNATDNAAAAQAANSTTAAAAAHAYGASSQGVKSTASPTAQKLALTAGIRPVNNASTATKAGVSLHKYRNHPASARNDTAAPAQAASQATGVETPVAPIKVVTSDAAQDNAAEAALEHEADVGEQSPEKGLGPTTYVVPKVAKMWTIPPDQKFVLPADLKLALPADMPVVPGMKPLTPEQIEQLRQLLHQHNLQHMQGLTREQLKKLLEARKNAERPTSDQATNSQTAALPDEPDDTLKPRRPARPRLAAADDAPVLPPGLTSPFKYKPWSPVWRERYAMFVQQTPMDNTLVDPATDLLPQPTAPFATNSAGATTVRPTLLAALPANANPATSNAAATGFNQPGTQSPTNTQSLIGGQGASATSPPLSQTNPTHGSGAEAANANSTGNAHPDAPLLGTGQAGATVPPTGTTTTEQPTTGAAGPTQPASPTNNTQTAGSTAPNPGVLGSGTGQNSQAATGQTSSGQGPANPSPGGNGQANSASPNGTQPNGASSNGAQAGTSAANNNQAGVLGAGQPGHDTPAAGQNAQAGSGAGQPGTTQAGVAQTGTTQSSAGQQGATQAGTAQSGTGHPNGAQTGNGVLGSGTSQAPTQPATSAAGTGVAGSGAGQTGSTGTDQTNAGQNNGGVLGSGTAQAGTGQAGTPPGTGLLGSGTNQAGDNQTGTGAAGAGQAGTGVLGAGQAGTGQPAAGQSGTGQQNTGPVGTGVLGSGTPDNAAPGVLGTGPVGTGTQGTGSPGVLGAGQTGTGQNGTGTATPPGTGPTDATAAGGDFGNEDQGDMGGDAFVDNEGIAGDEPTADAINPDAAGFTPAEGVQPNMPPHTHDLQKGIPGALVLPPLPPLGVEAGTNPVPRTVKPVLRLASAVPPRFQTPPPGAPAPATKARPQASQARAAMAAQAGGEQPHPPVPEAVAPKPASAPQTASPKPVPPAISFGSTSENGTILMPLTKNPLALGLVPDTELTNNATVVRAPAQHPGRAANRSVRPVTATEPPARRKLGVEGQATSAQEPRQITPTKPAIAHRAMGQATPVERSDDATVPETLPRKQSKNSQGIKEGSKNPLPPTPLPDSDAEIGDGSGLKGEYYLGRNLDQYQFTRADPNIDFVWATESNPSPNPRLPQGSDYSARWTGKIQPRYSETYTIYGVADDGIRVWVDHKLLIDAWAIHGVLEYSGKIQLEAGKQYDIRVDYFEANGGGAAVGVYWESQSQKKEFIPEECLFYPLAGDKEALELDEKPHLVPIDKY